jgi:hypothetical protein
MSILFVDELKLHFADDIFQNLLPEKSVNIIVLKMLN